MATYPWAFVPVLGRWSPGKIARVTRCLFYGMHPSRAVQLKEGIPIGDLFLGANLGYQLSRKVLHLPDFDSCSKRRPK